MTSGPSLFQPCRCDSMSRRVTHSRGIFPSRCLFVTLPPRATLRPPLTVHRARRLNANDHLLNYQDKLWLKFPLLECQANQDRSSRQNASGQTYSGLDLAQEQSQTDSVMSIRRSILRVLLCISPHSEMAMRSGSVGFDRRHTKVLSTRHSFSRPVTPHASYDAHSSPLQRSQPDIVSLVSLFMHGNTDTLKDCAGPSSPSRFVLLCRTLCSTLILPLVLVL